jgi:2-C-methyl-D-erythritol 4-phosphate cytidylyltransferase
MIYSAIVAGGKGSRMKSDIPKQFLNVGGKPIIVRTIERFFECDRIDKIYVGVHGDWLEQLGEMCMEYGLGTQRVRLITGGSDRTETVFRIISAIIAENGITDDDIILTHDGVRPFVSDEIISRNILAMESCDGVTTALPSTDTLLHSADGRVVDSVPERIYLYRAQTPQTFRLKKLFDAYNSLSNEQKSRLTDTASVFAAAGLPVELTGGSDTNIKITTPFDMELATLILKSDTEDL